MGTKHLYSYGDVRTKVYPVTDTELRNLRHAAWFALTVVGIPFLIIEVLSFVRRLRRETEFD